MGGTMTKESFEDALAQLEEVVKALEDESVGLEEALKLFERGVKLAQRCRTQLEGVEQRVEQLLAETPEGEEPKTEAFAPEEG
jgi:exodeoxyribonuclease VII small subunit